MQFSILTIIILAGSLGWAEKLDKKIDKKNQVSARESGKEQVVDSAQVLTRTVAQVGNHVITSREVQISSVLEDFLYAPESSTKKILVDTNITPARISAVMLEWMLFFEAESFSVGAASEDSIAQQMQKIEQSISPNLQWKKLEVGKNELQELLRRKATAKNIVKVKTEFSGISISDSDAQDFFEKNKAKFGNVSFQSYKENIKSYLLQQAMQDRMKDWIEILKRKYRVRVMEFS